MRMMKRWGAAAAIAGLAAVGIAAAPQPAHAWVRFGFYLPPVVIGPPVYAAPPVYAPPVYAAPPVVYAPPPAYYPPRRVWIPPHWQGPYWVPGHWS